MKYLYLIAFLFSWVSGRAQLREDMQQRIRQLNRQGIDTVVYFAVSGSNFPPPIGQTYLPERSEYLIWSEKGRSYIQRFDDCYRYLPRFIDPVFMNLVINRYQELKTEKIWGENMTVNHGPYTFFCIYTPSGELVKPVNEIALNFLTEYNKKHPDKFEKNKRSIQKQLTRIARSAIKNSVIFVSGSNGLPGKINPAPECGHFFLR